MILPLHLCEKIVTMGFTKEMPSFYENGTYHPEKFESYTESIDLETNKPEIFSKQIMSGEGRIPALTFDQASDYLTEQGYTIAPGYEEKNKAVVHVYKGSEKLFTTRGTRLPEVVIIAFEELFEKHILI